MKKGVKITIGVLGVGLAFGVGIGGGYYLFAKNSQFNNDTKISEPIQKIENNDEIKDSNNETVISDESLINDLSTKITYLNVQGVTYSYDFSNAASRSNTIGAYNFRNIYDKKLSDDDMLDIALNSLVNDYEDLSIKYEDMSSELKDKEYFEMYANAIGGIDSFLPKQVSEEKVFERYQNLFGKKLSNHHTISSCPSFFYDNKNHVYYYWSECGGIQPGCVYLYKNKFTMKGDNAYVYVNTGHSGEDNNYFLTYDGYDSKKNNDSVIERATFKIDESNYMKYSEYKYTFKKDLNGNYYFVSVEKN